MIAQWQDGGMEKSYMVIAGTDDWDARRVEPWKYVVRDLLLWMAEPTLTQVNHLTGRHT
jgi:hypothetical protein